MRVETDGGALGKRQPAGFGDGSGFAIGMSQVGEGHGDDAIH